jgi:pimeloyl-ACP methyl ester carboxylesterase
LWREVFDGFLAFDDRADLERITAQSLILWGDQDALFPRVDQDRLAAVTPNAQLQIYPETGHCPNWERPEQVAADLDTFLRRWPP